MASPTPVRDPNKIQEGFRAVPIFGSDDGSLLRLCVMVREASEPAAGIFVRLREMADATVYLGCLADRGGAIHQWVELRIQNVDRAGSTPEAQREVLTNAALDERWRRRAPLLRRQQQGIEMEAERTHPLPIFFDLAVTKAVEPMASGAPWELCTDDKLLEANGLPPFHGSLARYLCVRGSGKGPFVPVTPDAPANDATQTMAAAFPELVPFNAGGGLMMALRFAPLGFEEFLDVLGGSEWKGVGEGTGAFGLAGVYRDLGDADRIRHGGAHLFSIRRGRAGLLAEVFHLKLAMLLQAFGRVRDHVREEQLPFLAVSADAFRVSLAELGSGLPALWSANVSLAVPGNGVPLAAAPGRSIVTGMEISIYRPTTKQPVRGTGEVRIRQITPDGEGMAVIEGTLSTQENIGEELFWFRLALPGGRIDFFARRTAEETPGVLAFRTISRAVDTYHETALRSAMESGFAQTPFETLPTQSSPFDLHGLAVLGVRALLVNGENSLDQALAELRELAGGAGAGAPETFGERLRAAAADPRWTGALGPHRLLAPGSVSAEEALAYLLAELWWDAVAMMARCFPGLTPEAFCTKPDETPGPGIESVFEPAIHEIERLCLRSRSLLFADWKYGEEARAALEAALGAIA